jgi:hypothetical protein
MNEPRKFELYDGTRQALAASAMSNLDMRRAMTEGHDVIARWWLMIRRMVIWLRRVLHGEHGRSWVRLVTVVGRSSDYGRGSPIAAKVRTARTARQRRPQPKRDDHAEAHSVRREAALEKVNKICTGRFISN